MSKNKLTIELGKTTIIFGLILFSLGYFIGNTLPITSIQTNNELAPLNDNIQPKVIDKISIENDPILGDINAPVKIYEFSDFQCPFCQRFYSDSIKQIEKEYIETGKVVLIYKDFPLPSHSAAIPAAIYSNCANEQGKWKEFHDVIFTNQNFVSSIEGLNQITKMIDLNQDELEKCIAREDEHLKEIQSDLEEGVSFGISGTPSILIGNDKNGYELIVGAQPYSFIKQKIESYL